MRQSCTCGREIALSLKEKKKSRHACVRLCVIFYERIFTVPMRQRSAAVILHPLHFSLFSDCFFIALSIDPLLFVISALRGWLTMGTPTAKQSRINYPNDFVIQRSLFFRSLFFSSPLDILLSDWQFRQIHLQIVQSYHLSFNMYLLISPARNEKAKTPGSREKFPLWKIYARYHFCKLKISSQKFGNSNDLRGSHISSCKFIIFSITEDLQSVLLSCPGRSSRRIGDAYI